MTRTELQPVAPPPDTAPPDGQDPSAGGLLSHDMRAALSRIVSASQALESASLSQSDAAHVKQIHTAALYINGLLSLADEAEMFRGEVSKLAPLLAQLEALWAPEARRKNIAFSLQRETGLPGAIRLSEIDFLRIFNNIIGNALKFSHQGALHLRLARDQNGALLVEVCDDGPGFSAAAREKLFSLHGRPDGAGEDGSGFGLYIAWALVQKAGARITADNPDSGGARVSVLFPEDMLIAPESPAESPDPGLPDLSHLRVLLAEDNPTNQLVATQMLAKMGARVETAADGVEALAAFDGGDFSLGLIDIEMPRKSGLEVLREMRARSDEKAATTLLALTAYVLPEHRDRIMAAGADGIIAKPLTDIAAFGNAILLVTGGPDTAPSPPPPQAEGNADAAIQMDVYNGLKDIIGEDSMRELLSKVQTDLAGVRVNLRQGVAGKDPALIRAGTHILISVAGAFGAINLQHIAETLNATAKTGDWARIVPEATRCESGISDVLRFVTAQLEP